MEQENTYTLEALKKLPKKQLLEMNILQLSFPHGSAIEKIIFKSDLMKPAEEVTLEELLNISFDTLLTSKKNRLNVPKVGDKTMVDIHTYIVDLGFKMGRHPFLSIPKTFKMKKHKRERSSKEMITDLMEQCGLRKEQACKAIDYLKENSLK